MQKAAFYTMKSGELQCEKRHIANIHFIFIEGFNITMSQCGVRYWKSCITW